MNRLNSRNRIAFVSSYPAKTGGAAAFTWRGTDTMTQVSNTCIDPVLIVVQSDVSETYSGDVDFVIHKGVMSDYMEASDFINTGNICQVELIMESRLLGGDAGMGIELVLRHIHVPIVTTLLCIPPKPSPACFQRLTDICDASWKIIVMDRYEMDLLEKTYGVACHKIERVAHDLQIISSRDAGQWDESAAVSPFERNRKRCLCNGFYG